jgi:hypothetical protein
MNITLIIRFTCLIIEKHRLRVGVKVINDGVISWFSILFAPFIDTKCEPRIQKSNDSKLEIYAEAPRSNTYVFYSLVKQKYREALTRKFNYRYSFSNFRYCVTALLQYPY